MNTSCSNSAGHAIPEVEAFIYPDTETGATLAVNPPEASAQPQSANFAKPDNVPRISEEEISRLVSEARAEGMAEGARQTESRLRNDLERERQRISEAIASFQQKCRDYYSQVELELVHLSLAIAAKILHRESQVDRMVVAGLVKVMLERLHQNTKVVVRVHPGNEEDWRRYFRDHAGLQVAGDPNLEPKACLLETELGVANMGLDSQLKEVEQGFFDLLAKKPEAR